MSVSTVDDENEGGWRSPFQHLEALPDAEALTARRRESIKKMQVMSINPSVQHALKDVVVGLMPCVVADGELEAWKLFECIAIAPPMQHRLTHRHITSHCLADPEAKLREMLIQTKARQLAML